MSIQILRAADRVATPWKNRLGVTREIAVHQPGAGLDDFDWRISMATVDAGGPFSTFQGIDRRLAVLEGRLTLTIDGGAPVTLDAASPAVAFAGDVPVEAAVLAGPVTDLNVMTRRGRVRATLERRVIDRPTTVEATETTLVLACAQIDVVGGGYRYRLEDDDAARLDQAVRLEPVGRSIVFIIILSIS